MTVTPADWRVGVQARRRAVGLGHLRHRARVVVRVDGDHAGRRSTPAAAGPTRSTTNVDVPGRLTHGHLPENHNHGGAFSGLPDPRELLAAPLPRARHGRDPRLRLRPRRPLRDRHAAAARRPCRRGRSLTLRQPRRRRRTILHTITSCKAPCNRTTGHRLPARRRPGAVRLRQPRLRARGLRRRRRSARPWKTPKSLRAGHLHVLLPRAPVHARRLPRPRALTDCGHDAQPARGAAGRLRLRRQPRRGDLQRLARRRLQPRPGSLAARDARGARRGAPRRRASSSSTSSAASSTAPARSSCSPARRTTWSSVRISSTAFAELRVRARERLASRSAEQRRREPVGGRAVAQRDAHVPLVAPGRAGRDVDPLRRRGGARSPRRPPRSSASQTRWPVAGGERERAAAQGVGEPLALARGGGAAARDHRVAVADRPQHRGLRGRRDAAGGLSAVEQLGVVGERVAGRAGRPSRAPSRTSAPRARARARRAGRRGRSSGANSASAASTTSQTGSGEALGQVAQAGGRTRAGRVVRAAEHDRAGVRLDGRQRFGVGRAAVGQRHRHRRAAGLVHEPGSGLQPGQAIATRPPAAIAAERARAAARRRRGRAPPARRSTPWRAASASRSAPSSG